MGLGGVGRSISTTYKLWDLGLVIYILGASVSSLLKQDKRQQEKKKKRKEKWEKRHKKSGLLRNGLR